MASPEAAVFTSGAQDPASGKLNVACLGPENTFSEGLALVRYFPRLGDLRETVIRLTESIDEVYAKVVNNDYGGGETVGLVPIENIPKGVITSNVMPLITGEHGIEVDVEEELTFRVRLMLAVPIDRSTGQVIPIDQIEKVYSYRSALDQADRFMQGHNLKGEPVASTAKAAELAARRARKGEKVAAICSINAAHHYELAIIEEDIQDFKENQTRFYAVTARNGGPGPDLGRLLVGSEMGGLADDDEAKVIGIVRPTRPWRERGYRLATRQFDEMGVVDYELYRLNWQEDETIGGDRSHLVEFIGKPATLHEAFIDPDTYGAEMSFQLLGVIPRGKSFSE